MAFIEVLALGYTLPGKRLLFSDVEFKVASGQRVALIGGNGVGKSTVLRVIAGEDQEHVGTARVEGTLLYMRQFVASPATTVRELLRGLLPMSMRTAGEELTAAERAAEHDRTEAAGLRYAEAVARWQELGGYAEEAAWHAACGIVLGQPYDAVIDRPIAQLSGGEAKRLLLEAIFRSEANILLLDEPDNFLDLDGKRWLEPLAAYAGTVVAVSHDRWFLRGFGRLIEFRRDGTVAELQHAA